jgi:translation initiation factor eIF-2B subunit epsilon
MPPKKTKQVVKDERLQAIVLTDSFETRFMPLTSVKPRCLMPLANVPLIEYTLEFLAKAGVDEVYLICCNHADQIQAYIEQSKWNLPWSPFKIQTIMTLESRSVGDAMRDVDNRGLITGDFLLVSGDVVTNIEFDKAMEAHKAKKAKDKDHIATMVLTKANALHRTRSHFATFILDNDDKCLYYQDIPPNEKSISIDPELLEDVDEFVVRNDLIDCHVDICSPHVPAIFQENFDYQYLRADFVKGTLSSDILKKSIYAYITDDYAARVESWQTYEAVTQDILARWTYPVVPDANFLNQSYTHEGSHIYKEKNVVLAQSCKIGSCVAIGANTHIGDGTFIENSVIGSNCKIGKNTIIKNSYIWDGAVINDDCIIEHSIIANDSKIGNNAKVTKAVIGFNVEVPQNKELSNNKVSSSKIHDDNETESAGYIHESDDSLIYDMEDLYLSDDSIISIKQKKKRSYSTTSVATDYEEEDFEKEAIATVERALEHNHDLDTALLELNTLRMSMDVTYHEVRFATSTALINRIYHFIDTQTLNAKDATGKIFKQWGPLFKRQVFDAEEEIDLLEILENLIKPDAKQILFYILSILYDLEIVEEESILKWWAASTKDNEYVGKFVDWLQEAEEDSSDDDE